MWLRTLFDSPIARGSRTPARGTPRRPESYRLRLEALDDRCLPSTFTVLNLNDTGPDSLRAAVAAANANPGADAIDFATTGTIALTSGQLDITDSLTINGPGAGALTVSGNFSSRVFRITGDPTVVIADLTVANGGTFGDPDDPGGTGDGGDGLGGGLYVAGGTLTLERCVVSGNHAGGGTFGATGDPGGRGEGGDGLGGGLYVAGGTLTLERCVVSGNQAGGGAGAAYLGSGGAAAGGGLYVAGGAVYVNQSTVSGNRASGGSGGDGYYYLDMGGNGGAAAGGGIYVGAGKVQFYQSTLSGNLVVGGYAGSATLPGLPGGGEGGGLYVCGGTVTLDQSIVSGNYAFGGSGAAESIGGYAGNGGAAAGGGIRVATGTVQLYQSSLSGNTADGGSGGYSYSYGLYYADGVGVGGGLSIATAAPALVADLDTYTEANTIDNTADVDPNISGPYSLNGAFVRTLAVNGETTPEGNTGTRTVSFTVNLNAASSQTITVDYATADGTAVSGSDYQPTSGTLTFSPDETTKTVTVQVIGDRLAESNEAFFVNLSGPTNAVIVDGQGVGYIVDDEPRIGISDATRTEGNTGTTQFAFTVSLSAASDAPVTVGFATADGFATAGDDYQATSGTLTIPAGQTTGTITVLVNGDRLAEANESFFINLSSPTNAVIADGQGVGTVADDEPRISISDATKAEGKKNQTTLFTFTVTLSAAYDQAVTVSYRTADGMATTRGGDYVAKTGTLTFAPGETTKTVTIEVRGDSKREADEYFYLDLFGNSTNSLFTKKRGTGTILNDD